MARSWAEQLSAMSIPPVQDPGGPVLIVSAHPDDEVLAVGAWLAGQSERRLVFVTATDGEASHPGSPSITPDELRRRRPPELVAALRQLGIAAPDIHRLRLPDGGLRSSRGALVEQLAPLVDDADLVLAPYESDGHPDHDVVGEVVVELCGSATPVWRFPIWTWAWTEPAEHEWLSSLRVLASGPTERDRKHHAIDAFATQVKPLSAHPADLAVVEEALLRHAGVAPEVVLV